ncbi:putative kinesin, partial [Bimuria novae-zelandiae CBS 107.79]
MGSAISFGDANAGFQAGIVNGSVNTTFHLPPERRETPPLPDIVIPFARDADFVERGTTLDQLQQRCAAPDARAALVGLGGVGKSQLAIEHAYRTHEQSPETWVFWVHASNAARFEQSYRDIADCVKIAGRRDPQANIFKLVHDWLCDCKQRWLLVLDNVDDARFLLSGQANGDGRGQTTNAQVIRKPLREYLPHCERGSILFTTRNKEAALRLVELRDIIAVEPMDESQAIELCEKKLRTQGNSQYNRTDAAELAAALEYMPLAIVQAVAYILQRAPRCSITKYLDEYRKSERKKTTLLNYDEGQLQRDLEVSNSIIVTWQISFEYIQQTRSSAADLLSLMSFFDRQGIPEALLQRRASQRGAQRSQKEPKQDIWESDEEDDASQSSTSDDHFEDDIVALRNFCFISVDTSGTSFEMHALVQLATRMWLEDNSKLEQWKQQFVSNLCAAFPTGEYENWAACQALYAHAKAAIGQQPKDESSIAEWATVLYRAAWFAERIGHITDTEMLATKAMKARKKVLGQEHEDTLWSIAMVADAYSLGGRWDEAEKLRKQVMETHKKKLGADHPDTLTSMANLASTYRNQGRWDAAEELDVQVMETRKKKLGADHPDTLTSMANLAWTWKSLERSAKAISLLQECVRLRCQILRAGHPDLVSSSKTLAAW